MKFLIATALLVSGFVLLSMAAEGNPKPKKSGRLQHVVSFKFKEDASPEQIDNLVRAFGELPRKIKEIKSFEWGTNVSPEKHDKGFTHMFIVTFKTEKDRDTYLTHPAHQDFVKLVGPIVADVFVIDFWSTR